MIKLVLTDIDGTVLPHGQKIISARTMLAIRNLLHAGIGFGPSSGRERNALFNPFWGDRSLSQTGILANGKMVYVHGDLVYHQLLEHDELQVLLEAIHAERNCFLNYFAPRGLSGMGSRSYVVVDCPREEYLSVANVAYFQTPREFVDRLPRDVDVVSACVNCTGGQERIERIRQKLVEACPRFDFLQSSPTILDVTPHGVSKASALGVLCSQLDITPDEVLYLGDSDNDLAMMCAIPNSVCMGDGTRAAREAARWVVGRAADDAAAIAMEKVAATGGVEPADGWKF